MSPRVTCGAQANTLKLPEPSRTVSRRALRDVSYTPMSPYEL